MQKIEPEKVSCGNQFKRVETSLENVYFTQFYQHYLQNQMVGALNVD